MDKKRTKILDLLPEIAYKVEFSHNSLQRSTCLKNNDCKLLNPFRCKDLHESILSHQIVKVHQALEENLELDHMKIEGHITHA